MSDSISHKLPDADSALSSTVTGEVAVASVIIVFMLFVAALVLYLRLNGYSGAIGTYTPRPQNPVFAPNQPDITRKPLDPLVLNSLPATIFWSEDFKEEGVIKCAVCLSDLADGEKARILPDCKHGFHVECVDMWFRSNSTCPLCRSLVRVDNGVEPFVEIPVLESGDLADSQNSKVSFDEASSSAGSSFSERRQERMILIEIPGSGQELSSSSSTSLASGPDVERMRSL